MVSEATSMVIARWSLALLLEHQEPVSYTHLDVYKRQVLDKLPAVRNVSNKIIVLERT